MQRLREHLTLLLLGLLPFHAFLVTFGTKVLQGSGHAPMTSLSLWKESVLCFILALAAKEILLNKAKWRLDFLDWLIASLLILSIVVTATTHSDWMLYAFGFKYDFVPLIAFAMLRRASWSARFQDSAYSVLLSVGTVVAALGIGSLMAPSAWFMKLGYSDLHSLYRPDAPLAAFQHIESLGVRRMQSTMSGPNQFGLWLLLPWSISLVRKRYSAAVLIFTVILLSFSRSAWIASGVIFLIVLWRGFPRKVFYSAIGATFFAACIAFVTLYSFAPDILLRAGSNSEHIKRPLEAFHVIAANPFGLGLGTAGPASNRVSDTCVYLPPEADASWAADRPDLCVFVGGTQVQPEGPCTCPTLPENWYLQIGVEMGVLGAAIFLAITIFVVMQFASVPQLAFVGISIAALFLHAWEDSAVAYTTWILLALETVRRSRL